MTEENIDKRDRRIRREVPIYDEEGFVNAVFCVDIPRRGPPRDVTCSYTIYSLTPYGLCIGVESGNSGERRMGNNFISLIRSALCGFLRVPYELGERNREESIMFDDYMVKLLGRALIQDDRTIKK